MSEQIENPSAFPNENMALECQGMTLRDYFAAKAMQAILSNSVLLSQTSKDKSEQMEQVSLTSYKLADQMLKQRNLKHE